MMVQMERVEGETARNDPAPIRPLTLTGDELWLVYKNAGEIGTTDS